MLSTIQQKLKILTLAFFFFGFFALDASAATINKPPLYLSSNNGLVGYWTMDGSKVNWKTGAVTDSSGRGNTGTITNMATSTGVAIGKIGQALNFDGSNDYVVNAGSNTSLDNIRLITISAWIYPRSYGGGSLGRIVDKQQASAGGPIFFICTTTGLCNSSLNNSFKFVYGWSTTDGNWTAPTNSVLLNQWTHVAVTYNANSTTTNPIFYRNGVLVSTTRNNTPAGSVGNDSNNVLTIGNNTAVTRSFNGFIDEVRVYNRALGANEIATLYNSGVAKFNVSPTKYLTSGLVGYWTMDGSKVNWKTGAVTDSSGRGNTGFVKGMATSTGVGAGKIGQALNFDGGDDLVSLGSNIFGAPSSFTISAWVRTASTTGTKTIFSEWQGGVCGDAIFIIASATGYTQFNDGASGNNIGNTVVTNNMWHHVVYTYNVTTGKNYVDGVAQTNSTAAAWRNTCTLDVRIGGTASNSNWFEGNLDEVRVYNRALGANEIATLYNSGAAKFNVSPTKYLTDGLVGYWTMDGSKVNWKTGAVTDSSGRGNTGFVKGMATSTGVGAGKIGQALNFDGGDDYVNVGTSLDQNGEVSISAWIKTDTVAEGIREIVANSDNAGTATDYLLEINRTAGRLTLLRSSLAVSVTSNTNLSVGVWYHVVGVLSGSSGNWTATLYLNGVSDGSAADANNPNGTNQTTAIGRLGASGALLFDGLIDEVRVYNRALSANEVMQLYNAGK